MRGGHPVRGAERTDVEHQRLRLLADRVSLLRERVGLRLGNGAPRPAGSAPSGPTRSTFVTGASRRRCGARHKPCTTDYSDFSSTSMEADFHASREGWSARCPVPATPPRPLRTTMAKGHEIPRTREPLRYSLRYTGDSAGLQWGALARGLGDGISAVSPPSKQHRVLPLYVQGPLPRRVVVIPQVSGGPHRSAGSH